MGGAMFDVPACALAVETASDLSLGAACRRAGAQAHTPHHTRACLEHVGRPDAQRQRHSLWDPVNVLQTGEQVQDLPAWCKSGGARHGGQHRHARNWKWNKVRLPAPRTSLQWCQPAPRHAPLRTTVDTSTHGVAAGTSGVDIRFVMDSNEGVWLNAAYCVCARARANWGRRRRPL